MGSLFGGQRNRFAAFAIVVAAIGSSCLGRLDPMDPVPELPKPLPTATPSASPSPSACSDSWTPLSLERGRSPDGKIAGVIQEARGWTLSIYRSRGDTGEWSLWNWDGEVWREWVEAYRLAHGYDAEPAGIARGTRGELLWYGSAVDPFSGPRPVRLAVVRISRDGGATWETLSHRSLQGGGMARFRAVWGSPDGPEGFWAVGQAENAFTTPIWTVFKWSSALKRFEVVDTHAVDPQAESEALSLEVDGKGRLWVTGYVQQLGYAKRWRARMSQDGGRSWKTLAGPPADASLLESRAVGWVQESGDSQLRAFGWIRTYEGITPVLEKQGAGFVAPAQKFGNRTPESSVKDARGRVWLAGTHTSASEGGAQSPWIATWDPTSDSWAEEPLEAFAGLGGIRALLADGGGRWTAWGDGGGKIWALRRGADCAP